MTMTTITAATTTSPFPTIDNIANLRRGTTTDATHAAPPVAADRWRGAFTRSGRSRRRHTDRWMLNDPTQMMLAVWMDHLSDGHSTTRMRSARRGSSHPLSFH